MHVITFFWFEPYFETLDFEMMAHFPNLKLEKVHTHHYSLLLFNYIELLNKQSDYILIFKGNNGK